MNLKSSELKGLIVFLLITIFIVMIFSFALFGITGIRVVLGTIFVSLPFYIILGNFGLAEGEKHVFSVLLGLTIFPSLAYLFGLVISFRTAIAASFIIFAGAAIVLWWRKLKKAGN